VEVFKPDLQAEKLVEDKKMSNVTLSKISMPKKPQDLTEIFITGWNLGKSTFEQIVPFTLIYGIANVLHLSFFSFEAGEANQAAVSPNFGFLNLLLSIVFISINLAVFSSIVYRINAQIEGKALDFNKDLMFGINKLTSVWPLTIVYAFCVVVGLILLVVPGIYLAILLYFSFYYVILKDVKVIDSLRKSKDLVSSNWFRTAAVLIGTGAVFAIFLQLLIFPFHHLPMIMALIEIAYYALVMPIFFGIYMALYYDLEVRQLEKPPVPDSTTII